MILGEFELAVGKSAGLMNLAIPVTFLSRTNAVGDNPNPGARRDGTVPLSKHLPASDLIPIIAELAPSKISAQDLATLEIGDIITTDHPAADPVILRVDGSPKFRARPISLGGRKAVRIESQLD